MAEKCTGTSCNMTFKPKKEKPISSYWILFFLLVALWVAGLIISEEVRSVTIAVFNYIKSDWQVFGAFVTLVFFTLIWAVLEGLAKGLHFIYLSNPDVYFYVKHALRFIIITFFLLTVLFRYITIWDFQDIWLYIVSGALTTLLAVIWFRGDNYTATVEKDIVQTKENMARPDYYDYFYVRFDAVILLTSVLGATLVFVYYYLSKSVDWIVEFVDVVLPQFFTNPFIFVLFLILLFVTVFSPITNFLADFLPPLAGRRALSIQTKIRTKKIRAWSLGFLVCVLFIKLIPGFNIPLWGKDLLSMAALLVSWIISAYRNRITHS